MLPRKYQQEAIAAVIARFDAGDQRTMIVAATGTGKTVTFSHVANHYLPNGRVMVLAHRSELIDQASDKLGKITNVLPSIEKANERSQEHSMHGKPSIVVSSIQTQISGSADKKRMHRFDPFEFSLVIVDECAHAPADSWRAVIDYYATNPNLKILGVTATPDRTDKLAMGTVFQSVAYTYDLPDAIDDGYLVPIHQRRVTIDGLDFSKCKTTAGDLNSGDLEEAMLFEKPLHGVAHATLEIACGLEEGSLESLKNLEDRSNRLASAMEAIDGRILKTLIFSVSVTHAERLAEIINRWLPESADFIHGGLTKDTRKAVLRRFRDGEIKFLVGCMVPTEGFDEPGIEMVVMGRPTKSRSLYAQMSGRGTRPIESIAAELGTLADALARRFCISSSEKPHVKILDFVGNSGRHKLVTTADILGGKYPEEVVNRAAEMSADESVDMMEALKTAKDELDRKKREAEEKKKLLEQQAKVRREAEAAKRAALVGTAKYTQQAVDPFNNYSPKIDRNETPPEHAHLKSSTVALLRRNKVPEYIMSRLDATAAGKLAQDIVARHAAGYCTFAQAALLQKKGYSKEETRTMTKEEASEAISIIAANNWHRPKGAA